MNKILMFKDTEKIEELKGYLDELLPLVQEIVHKFAALQVGELTNNNAYKMVDKAGFIKEMMVNGVKSPVLHGVPITKAAFMEMVQLPEGYETFIASVDQLLQELEPKHANDNYLKPLSIVVSKECAKTSYTPLGILLAFYEIKNNTAKVSQEVLNRYEARQSFYAETPSQQKLYNAFNELATAFNKVAPALHSSYFDFVYDIKGIQKRDGNFVVDHAHILRH